MSECNKCLGECRCPEPQPAAEQPAVWAVVSLMGHKQYAGRLTEEEKFGSKLGRLDIPEGDGFRSIYFGGGSVYSIDIVTEEVARIAAKRSMPKPVEAWELPKQLAAAQGHAPAAQRPYSDSEITGHDDDKDDDRPDELRW